MSKRIVIIKPHHFLDIIKLYGNGLEKFVPDESYGHDFYRVGNILLENRATKLKLVLGSDDICSTCKFLKGGKCSDVVVNHEPYTSKEEYNKLIDNRFFNQLGLKEGQIITALEFCRIIRDRFWNIFKIWRETEVPQEVTAIRKKNLLNGVAKYLSNPVLYEEVINL